MDWINYHHLLYFWTVAKEGSIARATETLHLAQPTISGQIRALEESLGEKLFRKSGRNLILTDMGQIVFRYADEIFSLGREMVDTLKGRPTGQAIRLIVGIADVLPKLITYRLLEPALQLPKPVRIICREDKSERLLMDLAIHSLDLVITDSIPNPNLKVKVFNHLLGECGVAFFGTKQFSSYKRHFPKSLDGAPLLLPTENCILRRSLDQWFASEGIHPRIVGEFEDSALLKVFGQKGLGIFPAPVVIESQICKQYLVQTIGKIDKVKERFFAVSVERKIKHPAVIAISEAAREKIFN